MQKKMILNIDPYALFNIYYIKTFSIHPKQTSIIQLKLQIDE